MSVVYLVVLSVPFLNFYQQSYRHTPIPPATTVNSGAVSTAAEPSTKVPQLSPGEVTAPDVKSVTEDRKDREATPPSRTAEERVETATDHRVGTLSHFVRAMMSHGFGCFIKED